MPRYRSYDHRVKQAIHDSCNPKLFPELNIPVSTAKSWIRKPRCSVVTSESLKKTDSELTIENQNLQKKILEIEAKQKLVVFTFKLFGLQIQYRRLPEKENKSLLLTAIHAACKQISKAEALGAIGLSLARFRYWCQLDKKCELKTDLKPCPKTIPSRLTNSEVEKIKSYILDEQFLHFSITSLSLYTKKIGDVFASPSSWFRVVREFNLRRTQKRLYPTKNLIGIRATYPNQYWHLDMSIIRLIDGTKVYIQSIIDNYSRLILAHHTSLKYGGVKTKNLIECAVSFSQENSHQKNSTQLLVDSGIENLNSNVDQTLFKHQIERKIAQIDMRQSNSMIEAFFRSLKNNYLYYQKLESFESVKKHVDKYIKDHNELIPHTAFRGETPLEKYSMNSAKQIEEMSKNNSRALLNRIQTNLASSCWHCTQ